MTAKGLAELDRRAECYVTKRGGLRVQPALLTWVADVAAAFAAREVDRARAEALEEAARLLDAVSAAWKATSLQSLPSGGSALRSMQDAANQLRARARAEKGTP